MSIEYETIEELGNIGEVSLELIDACNTNNGTRQTLFSLKKEKLSKQGYKYFQTFSFNKQQALELIDFLRLFTTRE